MANSNTQQIIKSTPIFTLKNTEIDYFHLDPDEVSHDAWHVVEERIDVQPNEYLSIERHFQSLDHSAQETVVLNVPVGYGKTTLCYNLIRKYHAEGYYVIVCSPFQKLVEKDYKALREFFSESQIYNYKQLDFDTSNYNFEEVIALEARIHVMTINCLLKNPGEDRLEQAFIKSRFLQKLKNTIRNNDKKIVFFFDELHESVANFKNELIPNLVTWRDLTHKCFVSSATFTCASIPVIRYFCLLTLGEIKIYYTPRNKVVADRLAKLHLHITTVPYSTKKLLPLAEIKEIIEAAISNGEKVNILCAYKIWVSTLTDKNSSEPVTQSVLSLNPNICTADTENEFDPERNNIGTNFKTGVNIYDPNANLIVILPIINKSSPFNSYGIFSDGIPALIQSLARLRNGGNIHVFMYSPETILDKDNHEQNIPAEILENTINRPYKKVNESYSWMQDRYDSMRRFLNNDIQYLQDIFEGAEELKYHYPTFQEILIDKSQAYMLSKNEWMGKNLSPYILWAAINNQFCNTILDKINFYTPLNNIVQLPDQGMEEVLFSLLSSHVVNELMEMTFRKGFVKLIEVLRYKEMTIERDNISGNATNIFVFKGKTITYDRLKLDKRLYIALVKIILKVKGIDADFNKIDYIRNCVFKAESIRVDRYSTPLTKLYKRFYHIKESFVEYVNTKVINYKGRLLLHPSYGTEIPNDLVSNMISLIYSLKENDIILQKAFTFFHNHKKNLDAGNITSDTKKIIVNELEALFLNFSTSRLSYQGVKHYILTNSHGIIYNIDFLV